MVERQHDGVILQCVQGDIVNQPDVDAVVNAANAQLQIGGGVAGAIHRAAGPGLEEECRPLAPIGPGEAVITGGHDLPNPYVIHCLGPVYGVDEPSGTLLAACYDNALNLAEETAIRAIAFPALSTGAFGYPMEDAARIAFRTIIARTHSLSVVRLVRFVLFRAEDLQIHVRVLDEVLSEAGPK